MYTIHCIENIVSMRKIKICGTMVNSWDPNYLDYDTLKITKLGLPHTLNLVVKYDRIFR